jgi:integrase
MDEKFQHFVPENTRIAHIKDLARFFAWGGAIPSTADQICLYITEHSETHKVSTIMRWLASISAEHQKQGLESPTRLRKVKDTLSRVRALNGMKQRRVAPLLVDHAKAIINTLDNSVADTRNKALILTGFYGAMRSSEIVSLDVDNFHFSRRGMDIIFHPNEGEPAGVKSCVTVVPNTEAAYCPVLAVKQWLNVSGIQEGPVFRAVNRHGGIGAQPLTVQGLEKIIKSLARRVGLDASEYSSHSLRLGLITSAIHSGKPIHKILDVTRHSSPASLAPYIQAVQKYI